MQLSEGRRGRSAELITHWVVFPGYRRKFLRSGSLFRCHTPEPPSGLESMILSTQLLQLPFLFPLCSVCACTLIKPDSARGLIRTTRNAKGRGWLSFRLVENLKSRISLSSSAWRYWCMWNVSLTPIYKQLRNENGTPWLLRETIRDHWYEQSNHKNCRSFFFFSDFPTDKTLSAETNPFNSICDHCPHLANCGCDCRSSLMRSRWSWWRRPSTESTSTTVSTRALASRASTAGVVSPWSRTTSAHARSASRTATVKTVSIASHFCFTKVPWLHCLKSNTVKNERK